MRGVKCKAVKFSREAVTFYLFLLTSHFSFLTSHFSLWVGCFPLSLSYARVRVISSFFADFSLKEHYFQNFYVSLPLEHWLMVLMEQETVKFYFFSLASAEVRQCDFRG